MAFKLAWTKSRKSYCSTPGVGVGVDVGVGFSKKFNVKVVYVIRKALSGELSCPCDRSCFLLSFVTVQIQNFCLYSDSPTSLSFMMTRPPAPSAL